MVVGGWRAWPAGGSSAAGRWRAAAARAGRWRCGWSPAASTCWRCPPGWLPGCGCTPRGHGRKTGRDDAMPVRLAALEGSGVLVVTSDDDLVSRRLLCGRREELTARRTHSVGRLHRLIAGLAPGGMRRELPAGKAQALLARIRPADDVGRVRLHIARGHLGPAGGRITVVAARDRRRPRVLAASWADLPPVSESAPRHRADQRR